MCGHARGFGPYCLAGATFNFGRRRSSEQPANQAVAGVDAIPGVALTITPFCQAFALGREETSACHRERCSCSGLIAIFDTLPKSIGYHSRDIRDRERVTRDERASCKLFV